MAKVMTNVLKTWRGLAALLALALGGLPPALAAGATNTFVLHRPQDTVDADLSDCDLLHTLHLIAHATGWQIAYEQGLTADISLKFHGLTEDDALRRVFGKFNFAKVPTNGSVRLLVFRTAPSAATVPLAASKNYLIPNELLVKLRRDSPVTIEQLAKQLHAKIVGRDDRNLLYRLQFDDQAAADAAGQALASSGDVAAVAHNFIVDPPNPAQSGPAAGGGFNPASLVDPKSPANGGLVIGLIDTAIQAQPDYSKYLLNPISVVGQASAPGGQPSHATAMLDTMVASMPDDPSMVQPVVIYKDGEQTTTFELMQGILAAVNAGDNPINLSLGGTGDSPLLQSLIEQAVAKGVVFVAASGNSGGSTPTYPAAYPGVLSVTAIDPTTGQLASYADDFSGVKTSASGTSYIPFGGQIWEVQGTSPATASVTAQLVNAYNQNHTPLNQLVNQWIQSHPAPQGR